MDVRAAYLTKGRASMYSGNDISGKIERYRKFYGGFEPGKLLIKTIFPMEGETPLDFAVHSQSFTSFDLFSWEGTKKYFDRVIGWQLRNARYHADVDDDWFPEMFIHLGSGAFGAFFDDTEVQFSPDTSWASPSILDWADMERLDAQKDTFWAKRFKDITAYVMERSRGEFFVSPDFHFSPLDAVNSLRGNGVFTDIYDEPEKTRRLLAYSTEVILRLQREFTDITGDLEGGQLVWNMWLPGKRAIGLQEDTCTLCSRAVYERFGREYTERIVAECGGGFIHTHMLGRHQFEALASIRGLGLLNIANDPNCPRAIDALDDELARANRLVPLNILCTPAELLEYAEKLSRIHAVLWVQCESREVARRTLNDVRKISCIK